MATSTRTDIHRPSAPEFDPQSYTYIGAYDWGSTPESIASQRQFTADLAEVRAQGYTRGGSDAGSCGHCGANFRYGALLIHPASLEYILVGDQCLGERFSGSKSDFDALRNGARRAAKERKEAAQSAARRVTFERMCQVHPDLAYATYAYSIGQAGAEYVTNEDPYCGEYTELRPGTSFESRTRQGWAISTLGDIAHKAERFGQVSEKQLALVAKLLVQLDEAAVRLVAEEAEAAAVPAVTEGRQVITGEVLSGKWVDHDFGSSYKITIRTASGQRLYGTAPAALEGEVIGRTVTLTATVKPNPDDHTHGFYSFPTKAAFVG